MYIDDVTPTPSVAENMSDIEASSVESVAPRPSPRYRIPQRRPPGTVGVLLRQPDLPTFNTPSPRLKHTEKIVGFIVKLLSQSK